MKIGPTWRVLGALIVGLLVGALAAGQGGAWRDPAVQVASTVGGLWLDALKMTVIPLIVALLISGIVGGADAARQGGAAGRSMLWFVMLLTASAIFGALVMPALIGLFPLPQAAAAALRAGLAGVDRETAAASVPGMADFVRSIVPPNVVKAAADGSILQIVVFTTLFAFAIARLPEDKRRPLAEFFDALGDAMLVIIGWILWLAPVGVLALAFAVGAGAGGAAFGAVLHYVLLVSSLGIAILLSAYAVAAVAAGWPIGKFARAMIAPQAVAISTQSSLASLPAMLRTARDLGVPTANADVTLPLSVALFRATGPAMNMGVAIYVAHWLGISLSPLALTTGVVVAAITTFSAVSLPGQLSFVSNIAPIALSMGVPIEPLAILIAVETVPDIFRTLGNVTMDVAVTGAVARRRPASPAQTV
ncbi:cation:dicarboxylase symporter family transporter [Sphingomonas sp.]|uniref:dicarboxylate/amino acid:cation symporter n=1 Tax=Sphingomonas sp. TaxID=28214 RepID=UPI0025FF3D88|nr:cation:dicarboxylase symporter family transporter [Sphingomonas sp.]